MGWLTAGLPCWLTHHTAVALNLSSPWSGPGVGRCLGPRDADTEAILGPGGRCQNKQSIWQREMQASCLQLSSGSPSKEAFSLGSSEGGRGWARLQGIFTFRRVASSQSQNRQQGTGPGGGSSPPFLRANTTSAPSPCLFLTRPSKFLVFARPLG